MMKFLIVCVAIIGVCAQVYGYGALSSQNQKISGHEGGGGGHGHEEDHVDYYAYPKYSYEYGVKDPKTGDNKEQWEARDGDKVTGGYKFKEADGTYRAVEYTADKHTGFNAVVQIIGKAVHPQVYKSDRHDGTGYKY